MFKHDGASCGDTDAGNDDFWCNWTTDRTLLRSRAMRLTRGNSDEADDILSTTVLNTLAYLRDHHARIRHPRGFLFFALNNEFISRCRRRAHERATIAAEIDVEALTDATTACGHDRTLHAQELLAAVLAEVDRLPSDQRLLFRMRFREERSYAEIASVFAISEPLARKRVQLLRERLRRAPGVAE